MQVVITYGTFDLFHEGHVNLFERARALGDHLIVAVSTDAFNAIKGKSSYFPYESRRRIVAACRYVDEVIAEAGWEQKRGDIRALGVSTFVMGSDWTGRFDDLRDICEVVYLPRTEGISTSLIRDELVRAGHRL
jgi:glycerol-3-phosphate cytidylyltransferase